MTRALRRQSEEVIPMDTMGYAGMRGFVKALATTKTSPKLRAAIEMAAFTASRPATSAS